MKNKIFIFVGIVLIAVGIICYFAIESGTVRINGNTIRDTGTINMVRYLVGGGIAGLGAIFMLAGLIGLFRGSQQLKRNQFILKNGIEAVGTVTFADKNYYITVNNRPVYSIVEYTYQDKSGITHTRKINNFNSEIMIRKQITVGSKITVKYSPQNPEESVMVL